MSATTPTPFLDLATVVTRLARTSGRLEKGHLVSEFLRKLAREEVAPAVLFLTGSIFAESDGRALNVGYATVQNAVAMAEEMAPPTEPLTVLEMQRRLHAISEIYGEDATDRRRALLTELVARTTSDERELLVRGILGEMRIGLNEAGMLDAIAEASGVPAPEVRAAQMFLGDVGRVAETALFEGPEAIRAVRLRLLCPMKPMLADVSEGPEDALAKHGGTTAVEYKMDGARVQIHRLDEEVRVFSRRLTDVTASLPEIVELIRTIPSRAFVVEGELLAVDATGRPLPFQELMRRFRRVHKIEAHRENVPLQLRLFDILHLDGTSLLDSPYRERFGTLDELVPANLVVEQRVVKSTEEFASFLSAAMDAGHEGVMAKRLDAPYTAGKRGQNWLKIKPADTLDVVLLAAEWGHGRRRGVLSNYWLGVRDGDHWQMIGKTFKGLTDAARARLMEDLLAIKVSEEPGVVHVRPELVVEVAYNDVQKSPTYSSGFALRFARVTRIRSDKGPQDADTYQRLKALYEKQFERKGRARDAS
ncbi:MAG: ATP-dependent DNA ligase [Myxococcaceae bacterium]